LKSHEQVGSEPADGVPIGVPVHGLENMPTRFAPVKSVPSRMDKFRLAPLRFAF